MFLRGGVGVPGPEAPSEPTQDRGSQLPFIRESSWKDTVRGSEAHTLVTHSAGVWGWPCPPSVPKEQP